MSFPAIRIKRRTKKSQSESTQFLKALENKNADKPFKKWEIPKAKSSVTALDDDKSIRSELVGIFGLGGAGSKITLSVYGNRLPHGCGRGFAIDIDRNYPIFQKDGPVDVKLLKGSGLLFATGGVFTLSENMLLKILEKPEESFDEDTANAVDSYLIGPAGKRYSMIFTVTATGGGTGNGFLRAITSKYGGEIKSRLSPVGILPFGGSPPAEYLNSLAFFGMMDRIHKNICLPTVVAVENDALSSLARSSDLRIMNNVIGSCIRSLVISLAGSIEQGLSWGNIDRSFLSFNSKKQLSVSTFGYSNSIKKRGVGYHSIEKAFILAHKQNLLGLSIGRDPNIGSNLKGIAFVTAPKGIDPGMVKHMIQGLSHKIWSDVDYEIEEVFVHTVSKISAIDLVVWFGGRITPPNLQKTIIYNDEKIKSHIEDRINIFRQNMKGLSSPMSTDDFIKNAEQDFYSGYELIKRFMVKRR